MQALLTFLKSHRCVVRDISLQALKEEQMESPDVKPALAPVSVYISASTWFNWFLKNCLCGLLRLPGHHLQFVHQR